MKNRTWTTYNKCIHFSQYLVKIAQVSYRDLETLNYALVLFSSSTLIISSFIIWAEFSKQLQIIIFPLFRNQNVISIKQKQVKLHFLHWLNYTEWKSWWVLSDKQFQHILILFKEPLFTRNLLIFVFQFWSAFHIEDKRFFCSIVYTCLILLLLSDHNANAIDTCIVLSCQRQKCCIFVYVDVI